MNVNVPEDNPPAFQTTKRDAKQARLVIAIWSVHANPDDLTNPHPPHRVRAKKALALQALVDPTYEQVSKIVGIDLSGCCSRCNARTEIVTIHDDGAMGPYESNQLDLCEACLRGALKALTE